MGGEERVCVADANATYDCGRRDFAPTVSPQQCLGLNGFDRRGEFAAPTVAGSGFASRM